MLHNNLIVAPTIKLFNTTMVWTVGKLANVITRAMFVSGCLRRVGRKGHATLKWAHWYELTIFLLFCYEIKRQYGEISFSHLKSVTFVWNSLISQFKVDLKINVFITFQKWCSGRKSGVFNVRRNPYTSSRSAKEKL